MMVMMMMKCVAIAFKAFISKELNKEFVIIQPASNKTEK
jgi:hypothetical protein